MKKANPYIQDTTESTHKMTINDAREHSMAQSHRALGEVSEATASSEVFMRPALSGFRDAPNILVPSRRIVDLNTLLTLPRPPILGKRGYVTRQITNCRPYACTSVPEEEELLEATNSWQLPFIGRSF